MTQAKCCVLGLAEDGGLLLEAVRTNPRLALAAVADRDRDLAAKAADVTGAERYDDYRHAIAASAAEGIEVILVALPAFETEEYLPLAAEKGLAAFVLPPMARNLEATVKLVGLFEQARCPLHVAQPWRHEPAFHALLDLDATAGRVCAAHAYASQTVRQPLNWRADAQRSGGGALLQDAYEIVDLIVTLMDVPDVVFAAPGVVAAPGQARSYDTEDAAAIVLRYADDRGAAITTCRSADKADWGVVLYGSKATVHVSPGGLTVSDADGRRITDAVSEHDNRFVPAVADFILTRATSAGQTRLGSGDPLRTMATIQAAYLSAKTGQAESPHRLLEMGSATRR